ncbi:unnamed protein product [Candidula unifasciata]|uniref:Membrane insertase YidC/Oxa/ALB C-terminal domain-containing protein n=1 Tax=Candidula unifasciata TaxID=100452 RepID=A0A8S3ZID9_9EUPU|nr:unnamed protein product [Candidula unifasciata]
MYNFNDIFKCRSLLTFFSFYLQIPSSRSFCSQQSGYHARHMREHKHVFVNSTLYRHIRITSSATLVLESSGYIPPVPPLPDVSNSLSEMTGALNALGEPTLQSVGLGTFWPAGLVQQGLELLHAGLGLPWWGSIVVGTIIIRTCMFPLVVKSQKMSINLMNHMPTVQRLQQKFSDARQRGNMMEAVRYGSELADYMKRNNVKPFNQLLMPICQIPIFLSVFVGLRGMANLPVESMKTGGTLWFPDLTITEPFYGLPMLTAFTFWLTVEVGVDGISAQTQAHIMKWVLRAMPLIMWPFISNFPAAMLVYWFTSNSFSLLQVSFLKIPSVRQFFKIPEKTIHQIQPTEKKGFIEGFKDSYSNMKASQQVMERQRLDEKNFRKAAIGPVVKTYQYNPKAVTDPQKIVAKSTERGQQSNS